MPSSSVHSFTDPGDYAAAIRGASAEILVTQRGQFTASLTHIDLHSLRLQRLSADLAMVAHSYVEGGRASVSFRTHSGPSMTRRGVEFSMAVIARSRPDWTFYRRTAGRGSHAGISLPLNEIASLEPVAGFDLMPPRDDLMVTPDPSALARLRRLHAAAGDLAEDAPAVLSHPEPARGLEQALIEAMLACLGTAEALEDRTAWRSHTAIMRRFHGVVEQHLDRPLYVPELCKEVGASERTLRACCEEQLGMGPKRYLLLRRMHMARHALQRSRREETTVTQIATRYGFWQFGRFAAEYKGLFGETPSNTLARPA